jgi:hypothetical protein
MVRLHAQQVGHQRDDERLRDGLAIADRQRSVGIGVAAQSVGHEFVPRYVAHDFEYLGCKRLSAERGSCPLRVGRDRRHHAGALGSEIILGRRGRQTSGSQERQKNAESEQQSEVRAALDRPARRSAAHVTRCLVL